MSTDVMSPGRTGEADGRRDPRRAAAEGAKAVQAPGARRPSRPARRPRPDRPGSPVHPASPVRPASPARPAGPGRSGRTIRTGGPRWQSHEDQRTLAARAGRSGHPIGARGVEQIGRTSFVMLVLGLLGGGLVCLLVVNTTLAASSIEIGNLQQANAARSERVQQLRQLIAAERSAAVIEKEALRLGMRPDPVLTTINLRTGSIGTGAGPGAGPGAAAGTGARAPATSGSGQ